MRLCSIEQVATEVNDALRKHYRPPSNSMRTAT